MFAPHAMPIVVGGHDLHQTVPDLGATELFLGGRARDVALQHHVAVIRRADLAPAVLRKKVEETCDLGETLRLFGHVFAKPSGIRALALVLAIDRKSTRLNSSHRTISY